MIIRDKCVKIPEFCEEDALIKNGEKDIYKRALFFDLEHYIYKKPVCIGVFGCCYYEEKDHELKVTQYMIENQEDSEIIIEIAKDYFENIIENKKKDYIVTFSGNNDYSVIRYLFEKHKIEFSIDEKFRHVDLQKEYEAERKEGIGLKALEKIFEIERAGELISGSNLAKTFCKIFKDNNYIGRIPRQKVEKILTYNEQDIISLFHICVNWNKLKYMYRPEVVEKRGAAGRMSV